MITMTTYAQELKQVTWPSVRVATKGLMLVCGLTLLYGGVLLAADSIISFSIRSLLP